MIRISNVKMRPVPTMEKPWRFQSLGDAVTFARISMQKVWATTTGLDIHEVWPGGRVTDYSAARAHMRARKLAKKLGTGSGTQ